MEHLPRPALSWVGISDLVLREFISQYILFVRDLKAGIRVFGCIYDNLYSPYKR